MTESTIISVPPEFIRVPKHRLRQLRPDKVDELAKSMDAIGLRTPIGVRWAKDGDAERSHLELVVGHHRLAASVKLGWEDIECQVIEDDVVDCRLWEIAENLHRADLTPMERMEHIGAWIALWFEREAAQKATAPAASGPRPPGRPRGGVNAAARELNIERHEAQNAAIITNMTPEAKDEARKLKLDDTRKALLAAAKEKGAEAQITELRNFIKRRKIEPAKNAEPRRKAEAATTADIGGLLRESAADPLWSVPADDAAAVVRDPNLEALLSAMRELLSREDLERYARLAHGVRPIISAAAVFELARDWAPAE